MLNLEWILNAWKTCNSYLEYEGDPKIIFIYENLSIYSYRFKFSHLQSTLHLMQYIYQDFFSHCSKYFWTCQLQCCLVLLPIFCFTSPALAKHVPYRTFFIHRSKKKSLLEWDWVLGNVGHGGHDVFSQKLLNTQSGVSRWVCKSPIMKWANMLKVSSKKKFTKA